MVEHTEKLEDTNVLIPWYPISYLTIASSVFFWGRLRVPTYYSLQYNWFQDFFGIYPFGQGIYPKIAGRYLDIRLCSIPTVGVYEKQGKLHLTRSTSY